MAKFTVEHQTKLSQQETFNKVQKFFKENQSLKSLDSNLDFDVDEKNHTGRVKGSKFECDWQILGQPAKVVVTVNLSFLLTPFKGKVQETLQQKISQLFG